MVRSNSTYSIEKNGRVRVFIDVVKLKRTQNTPCMIVLWLLGGRIDNLKKIVIFGRARPGGPTLVDGLARIRPCPFLRPPWAVPLTRSGYAETGQPDLFDTFMIYIRVTLHNLFFS